MRRGALAEVPATEVRTDIQGLRAVAVMLVLLFHLWPSILVGGFVGVDVFFVISGFLITSHLLRHPPRRPGDFAAFWGRRLRRLLPASLLVIAVTVVVGLAVLPVTQLANLGRDALSSALYVENWTLAFNAVDYLGATQAPSPLQHYWSLGVEEQFYVLWPFLIGFAAWIVARAARLAAVVNVVVIGLFVAASLVVSIVWTATAPAFAYFATPTRLWELGAGGLVAAGAALWRGPALSAGLRAGLAWTGVAAIAVSAVIIDSGTPFPGVAALIPVAGSALFLAAQAGTEPWSPGRIAAWRPVQFIGDTSYAVYLWHFPLIVLGAAAFGGRLPFWAKLVVIAVCLVLGQLTRLLVEDPVRRSVWLRAPLVRTYGFAALATGIVVALTFLPIAQVQRVVAEREQLQAQNLIDNAGCVGAAALANDGCDLRGIGINPDPAVAIDDRSDAYADDCFSYTPFDQMPVCSYGDHDAGQRIALVGNSHAGQWLPALQELMKPLDFSVTTYLASRCAVSAAPQVFDTAAFTDACVAWGEKALAATIDGDYDLVVVTEASDGDLVGIPAEGQHDAKVDGYLPSLRDWAAAGIPVVVLRDTPQPQVEVDTCLAGHRDDVAACDGARDQWVLADPLAEAAEQLADPLVTVTDLNDLICGETVCYSVIGGILVYYDPRHLSATFSATLGPFLAPDIERALSSSS